MLTSLKTYFPLWYDLFAELLTFDKLAVNVEAEGGERLNVLKAAVIKDSSSPKRIRAMCVRTGNKSIPAINTEKSSFAQWPFKWSDNAAAINYRDYFIL